MQWGTRGAARHLVGLAQYLSIGPFRQIVPSLINFPAQLYSKMAVSGHSVIFGLVLMTFIHDGAAVNWVARTPPMGYNTWNHYGCSVDAQILTSTASALVSTGLAAKGYEYVNSDDCWMLANRTAEGNMIPNPTKFPNGFKAVADFIHGLGLKSGLYTAKACAQIELSSKYPTLSLILLRVE